MNKCFQIFCQSLYTLVDEKSHQILINILSLNFKELFQIISLSAEIIKFNLIPKLIEFLDHKNKFIALQSQEFVLKIVEVNHSHQVFDDILLSSHLFQKIPKLLQSSYNNELIPVIQRFINQSQYSVKLFQVSNFLEQLIYMIQSYQQRTTIDSMKIIAIILRKENVNEVQKLMNSGLLRYLKLLLIQVKEDELLILILESILDILKIGIQLTELGKQFKENYYLIEYDQLNMFTQVYNLLKNERCSNSCSNIINFY